MHRPNRKQPQTIAQRLVGELHGVQHALAHLNASVFGIVMELHDASIMTAALHYIKEGRTMEQAVKEAVQLSETVQRVLYPQNDEDEGGE